MPVSVLPENAWIYQISDDGFDLTAYGKTLKRFPDFDYYCCLDSWSVILCDNWLLNFFKALEGNKAGIAGATGSHESFFSNTPHKIWNWLFFGPFPNPHIRTTGFMMPGTIMKQVWPRFTPAKRIAYMAESGRNSITNKVRRLGRDAVVVNKSGQAFSPNAWRDSFTYRAGEQQLLMIADKQTNLFATASPEGRRRQSWAAWRREP